jgi:hypothetical protein
MKASAELGRIPARLGPDHVRRVQCRADSRGGLAAPQGWLINYEAAAYKLASGLDAVLARRSRPRRHAWSPFEPWQLANRTEHPTASPPQYQTLGRDDA